MAIRAIAAADADYSFLGNYCSSGSNCCSSAVGFSATRSPWPSGVCRDGRWPVTAVAVTRPSAKMESRWDGTQTGLEQQSRRRPSTSTWGQSPAITAHPPQAGEAPLGRGVPHPHKRQVPTPFRARGPPRATLAHTLAAVIDAGRSPRPEHTHRCPRPSAGHDRVAAGHPSSCRG